MKIRDLLAENETTLSFEVFPPKTEDSLSAVEEAARKIAALKPHFMSVTYGADGGASGLTARLSSDILNRYGTTVLAHLTCVNADRKKAEEMARLYQREGIENVLALRGDIPEGGRSCNDFPYAADLVRALKELAPSLCIGGACYPEGHIEAASPSEDIRHLKEKTDAGCDFLTTQMFFDNSTLYHFMYRIREAGITVPVLAGIMPITNERQVARSVRLSGATIPARFRMMVDRFGKDPQKMKQAGIIYAAEQIVDLMANGITHIHVYSMNKPEIASGLMRLLSELI